MIPWAGKIKPVRLFGAENDCSRIAFRTAYAAAVAERIETNYDEKTIMEFAI
ncbi:MAG: hypothetical protein ACLP7P_02110 [Rhodomicrobium sp.]